MNEKQNKPRCVIVFDTQESFNEIKDYAKARGLDMKNFFMFAAKERIARYPLKTASTQEDV